MGNKNYKKTSLYDDSLGKLFWKSGMIGLIILAFAELIILFVCIYSGYDKQDTPVLLLLMWAFGMVFLYLRTILSLLQVLRQQATIGIRWRDRADFDKPEYERDWYVMFDGGGFLLYHRNYIQKILRTLKEYQRSGDNHTREQWYTLFFEDITGKQRKIKFSSTALERDFRKWYKRENKHKAHTLDKGHSS